MSEPQKSALADLARALTDLGFERWISNDRYFAIQLEGIGEERGEFIIHVADDRTVSVEGPLVPLTLEALDLIRAWQAPPSPDAASFERARMAWGRAMFESGRIDMYDDVGPSIVPDDHRKEVSAAVKQARAALLAFGPSDAGRITEEITITEDEAKLICLTLNREQRIGGWPGPIELRVNDLIERLGGVADGGAHA